MNKIQQKYIILIFGFIIFLIGLTDASDLKKVAQSGMQYLKIGVDAQMVGKGEAGISAVNGLPSIFWNPAGLAELEGKDVLFSHNAWIADISIDAFAYGMDFGEWGVFAVNAVWVDYGDLLATRVGHTIEESGERGYVDEGTFSPIDLAIGLVYSRKISSQFSVGGQIRYLYEDYGSNVIVTTSGDDKKVKNTINTLAFDIGTRYYTGFKSLAFSMAIQNFSPDVKYHYESFSPPLTYKMGISMDLLDFTSDPSQSELILAIDALHPRDYTERLNFGMEYNYLGMFQLRSGYRMNYDEGQYTFGGGFKYSFNDGMRFRLDLSYLMMSSGRFTSPVQITAGINF